ncbi:MAG TPA: hypothetical protein V6D05_02200 [Stenomitos sp.]
MTAIPLVLALMLGAAPVASAQEPYAGSARVTPYLVSAHLQLALNHLRQAEAALATEPGERDTLRSNLGPVRQSLADVSDELALARMATADPDQLSAIDRMLAETDAVRDLLESRAAAVPDSLRRLEGDVLALHQTARSQIAMREDVITREESGRPAVR